jgi:tRNA(Ile)-lysidine synthase
MPSGPVTIALSGGADSAALAYLALETETEADALHVHHGFEGSARLAMAAQAIADQLGITLETVMVEVEPGPSPEDRARAARYAVFDRSERSLLTAHTRDDNAETMLINLIRGSGAEGLTGIPAHRLPAIYRPMLEVTRSETREIATLAGLKFVDDPMNEDLSLTRNRIRHKIVPLMRDLNPRVDEAMARAAATLARDAAYLDGSIDWAPTGAGLPAGVVVTLPRVLAERLIMRFLDAAGVGVTADRVDRVWAVARGETDRHDLADGRAVVRRGALVHLE